MPPGASSSGRPVPSNPVGSTGGPTRVPVGGAPTALSNPRWETRGHLHGDEARMAVDGPELDGRTVRFVVECLENGSWRRIAETTGTVEGGVARGQVRLEHPAAEACGDLHVPEGVDAGSRTIRFKASLA